MLFSFFKFRLINSPLLSLPYSSSSFTYPDEYFKVFRLADFEFSLPMFVEDPGKRARLLLEIKKLMNLIDEEGDDETEEPSVELDAMRQLNTCAEDPQNSKLEDDLENDPDLADQGESDDSDEENYLYDRFGTEKASLSSSVVAAAAKPSKPKEPEITKKKRNRLATIERLERRANSSDSNNRFFSYVQFQKDLAKVPLAVRPKGKQMKQFYNSLRDTMMKQKSQLTTSEYEAAAVLAACQYPWLWEKNFSGVVSLLNSIYFDTFH